MGFFEKISAGLKKTRDSIMGSVTSMLRSFTKIDEELFEELEEILIMADAGANTSARICDELRKKVRERGVTDPEEVRGLLKETVAELLRGGQEMQLSTKPSVILVIGVNGVGKTTTIGKLAARYKAEGKKVILAAADTFRAAAIEQLDVWGERAGVPVVKRDRGSDPASVCYDVLDEADAQGADLVLIDTAGRLHTSADLMRELAKVVNVTRKRAEKCKAGPMPVHVVLVLDAGTGQNGLNQALEFNEALGLDGVIMTKLDGTAKGGIALAVASKLKLPILRVGVGERIEDLQDFDAHDFCRALVGE